MKILIIFNLKEMNKMSITGNASKISSINTAKNKLSRIIIRNNSIGLTPHQVNSNIFDVVSNYQNNGHLMVKNYSSL